MAQPKETPLIALAEDGAVIPTGIGDLRRFRAWLHSKCFPERGRIDWIGGRLEVDMAAEDLYTHGTPKSAIACVLGKLIQEPERGLVFIDKARYTCPAVDLSVEPDILVLLVETLEAGRARLVPRSRGPRNRFIEIEGSVDLVVECVSDSSTAKDRKRLPLAYHRAGVREYWLVDARGPRLDFQILLRRPRRFEQSAAGKFGFALSAVLGRGVRLVRRRRGPGLVFFHLEVEEEN